MQPYFFPYIGYFQLINAVDEFIVYDNIQYTKKGWINRNRILVNNADDYITLPIAKASDFLNIKDRQLSPTWDQDQKRMLNKIREAYRKAPYFKDSFDLVAQCLTFQHPGLFEFILNSLKRTLQFLEIDTPLVISSTLPIDHSLRSEDKVLEICKSRSASTYINPIGGINLYNKDRFKDQGIVLFFLESKGQIYRQYNDSFVPWLSIIDVIMFNSVNEVKSLLLDYTLK